MKLNAEQKKRLIALRAIAKHNDAEEKEYQSLLKAEDAIATLSEDAVQAKRTALKAAGLTDEEIAAALKAGQDTQAAAALQKKRDALKVAGVSEKEIDRILKNSAATEALEARKASLKAAGLSDDEIAAALKSKKAAKADPEEEEECVDEDEEARLTSRITRAVTTAVAPLNTELANLRGLVKAGVAGKGGGAGPEEKEAKGAAGETFEITKINPLALIAMGRAQYPNGTTRKPELSN